MKNRWKSEKGSMAAYAIAMILSFIIILTGILTISSAVRKNQLRGMVEVKDVYENNAKQEEEVYDELISNMNFLIPREYQQVEYITIVNDQGNSSKSNCINTQIPFNEANKITFQYKSTDTYQKMMFVAGYASNKPQSHPYLANESTNDKGWTIASFSNYSVTPDILTREEASDGTIREVTFNYTATQDTLISFGSWTDVVWSRTIDWYSFKIWKDDTLLRDMIPCYHKQTNEIGMYDLISNEFYTNNSTVPFQKGQNVKPY